MVRTRGVDLPILGYNFELFNKLCDVDLMPNFFPPVESKQWQEIHHKQNHLMHKLWFQLRTSVCCSLMTVRPV